MMGDEQAPALQPIRVGATTLKNRLGLGPINPGFAHLTDSTSAAAIEFYRSYAEGGLGIVYIGGIAVSKSGRSNHNSSVMTDLRTVAIVADVVAALEASGSKPIAQLMHSGRQASSIETGAARIAASAGACPYYREQACAATKADIRGVIRDFRDSARKAVAAGCQIIEIHAAHGYLISGFLSAATNSRSDCYGGSIANRFRILREIVGSIRDATRLDLGVRINVLENDSRGLSVTEVLEGLEPIAGELDFISVSAGMYTSRDDDLIIPQRWRGQAPLRPYARLVRHELDIPVFIAGNIDSIDLANTLIADGSTDVALIVRSLLADPGLVRKWLAGRNDVRNCTELYLCKYHSRGANHVYCPHNTLLRSTLRPRVGRSRY